MAAPRLRAPAPPEGHEWFVAGPEEVDHGVFRIPMSVSVRELHAVNVYALCGSEGVDLVDAGDAAVTEVDQLDAALRAVGRRAADVRRVLVTHIHPDHYSLAPRLRERLGVEVHLGVGERPNLDSTNQLLRGERRPNVLDELDRVGGQQLAPLLDEKYTRARTGAELGGPDVWATDGQRIPTHAGDLTALATPGHTQGHLVYAHPERAAYFSGDHVLPHITPSIGFESVPVLHALGDYLASLDKMLHEPDGRLWPAHGPTGPSTHARVSELLRHHSLRLDATRAAVEDSGSTAYEVASRLQWTSRATAFADLAPWHRFLACTETAAHLEVLVSRGLLKRGPARAGRAGDGSTHVFRPATSTKP